MVDRETGGGPVELLIAAIVGGRSCRRSRSVDQVGHVCNYWSVGDEMPSRSTAQSEAGSPFALRLGKTSGKSPTHSS